MSQGVGVLSSLTFQGTGRGDNIIKTENYENGIPPPCPFLCVLV